jgi:hypothetical protein
MRESDYKVVGPGELLPAAATAQRVEACFDIRYT